MSPSEPYQSIPELMESIISVEKTIAHILNAEGEKIQKAVEISDNIGDLIELNRSVNKTLMNAVQLEQLNCQKLDAIGEICRSERDNPGRAGVSWPCSDNRRRQDCGCQTPEPRAAVFLAIAGRTWNCGTFMRLRQETYCGDKKAGDCENGYPYIMIPAGKKYKVEYEIALSNKRLTPVSTEINLCHKNDVLQTINIFEKDCGFSLKDCGAFVCETPRDLRNITLTVCLISGSNIEINYAKLSIAEIY